MTNDAETFDLINTLRAQAQKVDTYMQMDLDDLRETMDGLLVEVLEYGLFNGGKRVRPLLAVTAAELCGRTERDTYRLGIAFEYLHAATLFHDDIIDQSETRRGKDSIHKRFGTVEAILAGDFLHAHSMALIGELSGRAGLNVFCRATKGMVDGEFMQLRNAKRHNLSEMDYYNAIMGKTGLLISAACEVGGIYGGGRKAELLALKTYGDNLGCAFQIVDDLLDYLGDPVKTGKKLGNDLEEGKMTLPLILALNKMGNGGNGAPADHHHLLAILADRNLRKTRFSEVFDLIHKYNGFDDAKKRAEIAIQDAIASLQIFSSPLVSVKRNLLEGLAQYVISREK